MTTTLTKPTPSTRTAPVPLGPVDAPIPFGRLVRVEWSKATDTRAARWLIALTGAATVLAMLAPLLAPHRIDQSVTSYLGFTLIGLTTLLPVVVIMTLTAEWSQRTVLSTFIQEPRRTRVISAKVVVSLIMAGIATVFGAVVVAGSLGVAGLIGRDITNDLDTSVVVGFVLFVFVNMLMGVAFGALLHNTAASIVAFFLLPTLFGVLGAAVDSVGRWIDPSRTFQWMQDGEWSGHYAQIGVSLLLWLVLPLAAGLARTARREIK